MKRFVVALALVCALASPSYGRVIGHRPHGCPHAYCGCSASLFIFHRIIPALNRAAAWFRFPRTSPAPGMAAVRRDGHHVMVLERHVHGKIWITHDGNSGHHLTREHAVSIAHYVIVNPLAGRL